MTSLTVKGDCIYAKEDAQVFRNGFPEISLKEEWERNAGTDNMCKIEICYINNWNYSSHTTHLGPSCSAQVCSTKQLH